MHWILLICRGVNMYAMLVGKLPFRSPRQGTKRRQKLLEQITNGISESHEKEMAHLSSGARDLIGRLLQPSPRKRATLEGIMNHPWVTKEGTHPLTPYRQPSIDAGTQAAVSNSNYNLPVSEWHEGSHGTCTRVLNCLTLPNKWVDWIPTNASCLQ